MNAGDIAFWIVMAVIVYSVFGPVLKELIVLAWRGAVYALTGQWVHALAARVEPEPETDDNGLHHQPDPRGADVYDPSALNSALKAAKAAVSASADHGPSLGATPLGGIHSRRSTLSTASCSASPFPVSQK